MRGWWNLLRWHIRWERVRFLSLLAGVVIFTMIFIGISDAFQPAELQEMMNKMPDFLQKMAGHQADRMLTAEFWFASLVAHPIWLLLMLCFPVAAGLRCLAGMQSEGTMEWVLSQPISRNQVYLAGVVLLLGGSTLLCLGAGISTLVAGRIWFPGEISLSFVVACTVSTWAMMCAVSMLVLALSASLPRPAAITFAILIGMSFLFLLGSLWSPAEKVGWISVFSYHQPQKIYADGMNWGRPILAFGWTLALALIGWVQFRSRDLEGG